MRSKWALKRNPSWGVQGVSGQDKLILVVRKQLWGMKLSQSNHIRAQKWELTARTSGIAGPCREVPKASQEPQGILKTLPSSASNEQVKEARPKQTVQRELWGFYTGIVTECPPRHREGTFTSFTSSNSLHHLPLAAEFSSVPRRWCSWAEHSIWTKIK